MKLNSLAVATTCALLIAFPATAVEPVRIVAIGDSITAGGRTGVKEYTYRLPLSRMLKDENACVDFVGSRRAGLNPGAQWPQGEESEHEGFYGAKTAEVRDKLARDLPSFPAADVALVHLGTNDGDGFVEGDIIEPLKQIVALLRARNPEVKVLVAQINGPWGFRTMYLNFRVAQIAARLSTAASRVEAVDQHSGWDISNDTFDGVHPNLKGQRKMAERWLDAMKPFLRFSDSECQGDVELPAKLVTCTGPECRPQHNLPGAQIALPDQSRTATERSRLVAQ